MSTRSRSKRHLWIGFALIGAILLGLFFGAKWLIGELVMLDASLSAGLITASATVFVAVLSVLVSKHLEVKTSIRSQLREKKEPIYKELIDFIFEITFAEKLGREVASEEEMTEFMANTMRDLVIWGSPEVVKAFANFKRVAQEYEGAPELTSRLMFGVEDLFRAIRKDLGHGDLVLQRGDILRLYINDLDTYL